MRNIKKILFTTSEQKIIGFLAADPGGEFTEKDISKATSVKKSAVNLALRRLTEVKLVSRKKVGRSSLYKIERENFIVKEIKALQNILILSPLLKKLKSESQRIILFGSATRGENDKESDIDLFVQSNNPDKVRKIVLSSSLRSKIQLITKTSKDMIKINKNKPLFFQEIEKGRVIWEKHEE